MMGAAYAATLVGGTVSGMMVGDVLGAVPTATPVPATGATAAPKATADGTPVAAGAPTPRESLALSAGIVVGAMLFLLFGARVLKDARIA